MEELFWASSADAAIPTEVSISGGNEYYDDDDWTWDAGDSGAADGGNDGGNDNSNGGDTDGKGSDNDGGNDNSGGNDTGIVKSSKTNVVTTYLTNDGVTVTVVGEGNHQVWLSSGAYGTAQNINANPSWGQNVLVGNYAANLIVSGAGFNNLWGGQDYANDILIGGTSYDIFLCGKNEGSDVVTNSSAADCVNLYDATLSDIAFTASDGRGTIALQFKSGNVLSVQGNDFVSAAFVLADGSAYRYNHVTQAWQTA